MTDRAVVAADGERDDVVRRADVAHLAPTIRGAPLVTPDGRYIVVRGRLWRRADPRLSDHDRQSLVDRLMEARRSVARARKQDDGHALAAARAEVDAAKVALGERGAVWWHDGDPDLNRHLARNTPYADWFAAQATAG